MTPREPGPPAPLRLHDDVYEPAEDSELLVDVLRRDEPDLHGTRALDVGTGTGIVARALAQLGARVLAVDLSPLATRLARDNLRGLDADVARTDLATSLRGQFDVAAFNAPYLPSANHERIDGWLDHAFHGGEGGIETTLRLVRDLPRILAPDGRAYLVVSTRADLDTLREIVKAAGFGIEERGEARFFFEGVQVWRLTRG